MLRLWPVPVHVHDQDDRESSSGIADRLLETAGLARQGLKLESQSGGWLITVDSPVETGQVQLFVPQNRDEPARIVADTRGASQPEPFDRLFSEGHYAEAGIVAERELQSVREAVASEMTELSGDRPAVTREFAVSSSGRSLVRALQQVAAACLRNGNYERADTAIGEAIAICERAPDEYSSLLARLLHDRAATMYLHRSADEEGLLAVQREFAQVAARMEQLVGQDHPEMARVMTSRARLLISEFSYVEAEDLLTAALQIRTQALGADHPEVAESLLEMARLHAYREDHSEADELFRKAIAIREAHCGPHHPDVAEALFHYTDFLMYNMQDRVQAGPLMRRALAIWESTIGLDHALVSRETGFIQKVLSPQAPAEAE